MHRLVVSFWDCFTVTLGRLMYLNYIEGGGGVALAVLPWSHLVEYVQNCNILDQLGRKTLPTGQFFFFFF